MADPTTATSSGSSSRVRRLSRSVFRRPLLPSAAGSRTPLTAQAGLSLEPTTLTPDVLAVHWASVLFVLNSLKDETYTIELKRRIADNPEEACHSILRAAEGKEEGEEKRVASQVLRGIEDRQAYSEPRKPHSGTQPAAAAAAADCHDRVRKHAKDGPVSVSPHRYQPKRLRPVRWASQGICYEGLQLHVPQTVDRMIAKNQRVFEHVLMVSGSLPSSLKQISISIRIFGEEDSVLPLFRSAFPRPNLDIATADEGDKWASPVNPFYDDVVQASSHPEINCSGRKGSFNVHINGIPTNLLVLTFDPSRDLCNSLANGFGLPFGYCIETDGAAPFAYEMTVEAWVHSPWWWPETSWGRKPTLCAKLESRAVLNAHSPLS